MPSYRNERFVPLPAEAGGESTSDRAEAPTGGQVEFTDQQMERWARLLADGEVEFPEALSAQQAEALLTEVRRLRRTRLIRFIARQIARHIKRDLKSGATPEFKDV